ncbi:MAG: TatD family hydrolase [Pirellulales bacterium]|nr:TatD family hydrolase [Pirellulales bacterium]
MILFDTHAHLDQEDFDADRAAVVERARAAGVEKILCVGTSAASSAEAVRLADQFDAVRAAVGIHPNSAAEASADDWRRIEELLAHPRVVALGETGLDCYRDYTPWDVQEAFFERHLRLAQEHDLPVVIHCRDAAAETLVLLQAAADRGPFRGVLHAFSGDPAFAGQCLALGLYVSFAGNVTYKNKKFESLRAAAKVIPLDRLLVETDSPYLTPEPLRGKPKYNEPAHVVHTLACLAALRGVDAETLARQTTENAERLFLCKRNPQRSA